MLAVVVGMQHGVCRPGMLRIALQHGGRNLTRFHRHGKVPLARRNRREQPERVEHRRFVVLGIRTRQRTHAVGVHLVACCLRRAVARSQPEQRIDRVKVTLLTRRRRLQLAGSRRRGKPIQRSFGLVDAFVVPERLVIAERLAQYRERETRIDPLRFAERRDCIMVLEAVEKEHAADKRRLRRLRPGIGERDVTEERLRNSCGREAQPHGHNRQAKPQSSQRSRSDSPRSLFLRDLC